MQSQRVGLTVRVVPHQRIGERLCPAQNPLGLLGVLHYRDGVLVAVRAYLFLYLVNGNDKAHGVFTSPDLHGCEGGERSLAAGVRQIYNGEIKGLVKGFLHHEGKSKILGVILTTDDEAVVFGVNHVAPPLLFGISI